MADTTTDRAAVDQTPDPDEIDRAPATERGSKMPSMPGTTMDPKKRTLLRVDVEEGEGAATRRAVDDLMGTKPEARFRFIQERAEFAQTEALDI